MSIPDQYLTRRCNENFGLTSWRDLLRHLATLTLNSVTTPINPNYSFTVIATSTDLRGRGPSSFSASSRETRFGPLDPIPISGYRPVFPRDR